MDDTADTSAAVAPVPPLEPIVRLYPEDAFDWAGRDLDVADLDGDGPVEVAVAASHDQLPYEYGSELASVHLLQAPLESGYLAERAAVTWTSAGNAFDFGQKPLILPSTRQLGAGGDLHEIDSAFSVFDVPDKLPAETLTSDEHAAYFDQHEGDLHNLGVTSVSARCETPGGPALCLSGTSTVWTDMSGHVLVYELPVVGPQPLRDAAVTWLKGDVADFARTMAGDGDLDGDGRADLVVGAYGWTGYAGRIAVLHELPPGEHRLWDVADATLTGEVPGEHYGIGLDTADLDGDGHQDILVGAPLGDGGAFVFFGPFSGDRLASQADVVVSGGAEDEWLGYSLTAGDFTADGGADLAVGAPWSVYVDAPPGAVLLFDDPSGHLDVSDATWRLSSGVAEADAFGIAVKQGDIDGDGFADLVVGSPRDPTVAELAGSVTIFSGAGL